MDKVIEGVVTASKLLATFPVVQPVKALLHSRKFVLVAAGVFVDYLVTVRPEFEEIQVQLVAVITFLVVWLITQIAREDVSKNGVSPAQFAESLRIWLQAVEDRYGAVAAPEAREALPDPERFRGPS